MFVSGRDDGTLQDGVDTVVAESSAANQMRYVGSMLYTTADLATNDVYVQINYTVNQRNSPMPTQKQIWVDQYSTRTIYSFPYAEHITSNNLSFKDSANKKVYISTETTHGLPTKIESISSYAADVQPLVEKKEFIQNICDDLDRKMGGNFINTVGSLVSQTVRDKIISLMDSGKSETEALELLCPYSDNCLVTWAAAVTPLIEWSANKSHSYSFWMINSAEYESGLKDSPEVICPKSSNKNIVLMLDGYYSAAYNNFTAIPNIFNANSSPLADAFDDAQITVPQDRLNSYSKRGLFRYEYGDKIFTNSGRGAYVDKDQSTYFGINCGRFLGNTPSNWTDANIAKYGGITFTVSKLEDTKTIPIYYYTTPTPDKPEQTDPQTVSIDKPFTPNPPKNTTVTRVIIPDTPFTDTTPDNPPSKFPTGTILGWIFTEIKGIDLDNPPKLEIIDDDEE